MLSPRAANHGLETVARFAPDLEREDLMAVLAFAAQLARARRLQPVTPEVSHRRSPLLVWSK
jgi:uncharacterized protein (DUF433 family)